VVNISIKAGLLATNGEDDELQRAMESLMVVVAW
jgi:hypothetical protein